MGVKEAFKYVEVNSHYIVYNNFQDTLYFIAFAPAAPPREEVASFDYYFSYL